MSADKTWRRICDLDDLLSRIDFGIETLFCVQECMAERNDSYASALYGTYDYLRMLSKQARAQFDYLYDVALEAKKAVEP